MRTTLIPLLALLLAQNVSSQTEFSGENALGLLRSLAVDIGPRPMGSPADHRALAFAAERFREYGCDSVFIMPMTATTHVNTESGIAVGIKRGATKRIICVGAHIDSSDPEVPGADDDGSGAAVVMELARVFGHRQMQSTLVFCCFSGEEQGLEGSEYFVNNFSDLDSVSLMLQIDMADGLEVIDLDPDACGRSAPRWLVSAAVEEFHKLGYQHLRYPTHFFAINYSRGSGAGSDHEPFLTRGIPAICLTTDVDDPIHTPADNIENFRPAGLKRSGDVMLRLTERFDGGTPGPSTERYWLYLAGAWPIFIPLWGLWLFILLSVVVSLFGLLKLRIDREMPSPEAIRWSGLKIALDALIIVSFAYFSWDFMGLLKGLKHPWFLELGPYYLYAFFASLVGVWAGALLAGKLRLSRSPYIYSKRFFLIMSLFLILTLFVSVKVAVYPAAALLLFGGAMLVRWLPARIVLTALAPLGIIRLLFSEWSTMVIRTIAMSSPQSGNINAVMSAVSVVFFTICLVPLLFGIMAIVRDSKGLGSLGPFLRSRKFLPGVLVVLAGLTIYFLPRPAYDTIRSCLIHLDESVDMTNHTDEITLRGFDYITGALVRYAGRESLITAKTASITLRDRPALDTSIVSLEHREQKTLEGDTASFDIELRISSRERPYTVTVRYSGGKEGPLGFVTPLKYRHRADQSITVDWYSYPDTILTLPVKFRIADTGSVRETVSVVFSRAVEPVGVEREATYVIPRTTYEFSKAYNR